jgi:glycosyltransferase involved in cell wall biosynthesis
MDNYILIGMFIMNGKFNDNNYLPNLLESIENQNDKNFELLIVNN